MPARQFLSTCLNLHPLQTIPRAKALLLAVGLEMPAPLLVVTSLHWLDTLPALRRQQTRPAHLPAARYGFMLRLLAASRMQALLPLFLELLALWADLRLQMQISPRSLVQLKHLRNVLYLRVPLPMPARLPFHIKHPLNASYLQVALPMPARLPSPLGIPTF